ncbi:hypothetical protein ANO11243_056890 [Dothideomycetidae sp. 11243]|nr:hypothetical protein ANO11243_056890 [fungal sp. No.11243]
MECHFGPVAGLGMSFNSWYPPVSFMDTMTSPQMIEPVSSLYQAHTLSVPIDHFPTDPSYEPHSKASFKLRYWFDATSFKPGGPVIVFLAGETEGTNRLPSLQNGIIAQLTQATAGIGVVLEHRYYGKSIPTPDFSTANLRFLTTQQAMADAVYFAQSIVFPGLEKHNLTSLTTPYISYGRSYSGAQSAFLRVKYPDTFWGSIASSSPVKPSWDFWQYSNAIIKYGPRDCIRKQQAFVHVIDVLLMGKAKCTPAEKCSAARLKSAFGVGKLTHNDDLAFALLAPLGGWQQMHWIPALNSDIFPKYCKTITSSSIVYPGTKRLRDQVRLLIKSSDAADDAQLTISMLNLIGYFKATTLSGCRGCNPDRCLGMRNAKENARSDLRQTWRSWRYQVCTQWGLHVTGSGTPANQRPIISRLVTPEYLSIICREAFNITSEPKLSSVLAYGGNRMARDRLAFVDGERDPWRPAGPHGFEYGAPRRKSSITRPFLLIDGGVHGWDTFGVWPNETTANFPPKSVQSVHKQMIKFAKAWVREYHVKHSRRTKAVGSSAGLTS